MTFKLGYSLYVFILCAFLSLSPAAHAKTKKAKKATSTKSAKKEDKKEVKKVSNESVTIKTSMGEIKIKLFPKIAPKTVENFVGLATGTKAWKDPTTGQEVKGKPLYAGTIFHRIIPNFMIQGGDPRGNGSGGPGYQFEDEFSNEVKFNKPGILAMANAGPATNGSQFFITVAATEWLNNRHTIFGEVTSGMDVVQKIATAPRGPNDLPQTQIKIESVEVH